MADSRSGMLAELNLRRQRLEQYAAQDPSNPSLLCDLADVYLNLGMLDQARERLETALRLMPDSGPISFRLGTVMLASNQWQSAYDVFAGMADDPSNRSAVQYNKAFAALNAGRADEAIAVLEGIPETDQVGLERYHLMLGRSLYQTRQYERAKSHVDRFVEILPADIEGRVLLAQVTADLGQYAAAANTARGVLAERPDDALANLVFGEIAVFMQEPDLAEPPLLRSVERMPQLGRAWSALGFTAILRQQTDVAIERFQRAVSLMPDHLGTWHGLLWCQILRGDLVGARQSAEKAMQLDRTFADNHGALATIAFMTDRLDEAQQSVKRGLRLNPKSAASLFAQSLLASGRGDKLLGQQTIQKIFEGRKLPDGSSIESAMNRQAALYAKLQRGQATLH